MHVISTAVLSPKSDGGDDLVFVQQLDDGTTILLLADGASGAGYGREAAQVTVDVVKNYVATFHGFAWSMDEALEVADAEIRARGIEGDTTAVLLALQKNNYVISSIGDSECWMAGQRGLSCLTRQQRQRPRIGSGAKRASIEFGNVTGPMLLCSDGLRYALHDHKQWFAHSSRPEDWAPALAHDAYLNCGGKLPDDLSIITVA